MSDYLRESSTFDFESPTPKANHVMIFNAKGLPYTWAKSSEKSFSLSKISSILHY